MGILPNKVLITYFFCIECMFPSESPEILAIILLIILSHL